MTARPFSKEGRSNGPAGAMTATRAPGFSRGTGRNGTRALYPACVQQQRQPFPVPYGLFIVLGAYALGVVGYVWATYWNSDDYVAAAHYEAAGELLGLED